MEACWPPCPQSGRTPAWPRPSARQVRPSAAQTRPPSRQPRDSLVVRTQPYLARRHPHRHGRILLRTARAECPPARAAHDQQQRAGEHRKVHPQLVRPLATPIIDLLRSSCWCGRDMGGSGNPGNAAPPGRSARRPCPLAAAACESGPANDCSVHSPLLAPAHELQKPASPRTTIAACGQRCRMRRTIRSNSATVPSAASACAVRRRAHSTCSPHVMYSGQ